MKCSNRSFAIWPQQALYREQHKGRYPYIAVSA